MLGDVNTLLSRELLTGDIIEEIYKFLPSLSAVVNNGSPSDSTRNAAYYKAAQPERFAALPDGEIVDDVTDENGNVTTPGTFTTFFETHPIVCSDLGGLENGIQFRHMQLDRIANCESTADVMKTIYDYLYDNLIADPTNNALLTSVVGLAGLVGIPQAIADFLDAALDMDNSELANELILMLANEAGRHVLTAYAATAPTCTESGNTAYYVCEACGKWFADADATQEITDQNSVIVPATGHTPAEHYYADQDGHALICETCGVTLESGAHVDEDGDGLCDVCAFEIPAEPEEPTEPEQPTDPEQPTSPKNRPSPPRVRTTRPR